MLPYQIDVLRNINDLEGRVDRLETLESTGAKVGAGFTLIEEIILANNTTSLVQFAGIPQTFQHLWLLLSLRVYDEDEYALLWMTINGDTGASKYEWMYRYNFTIFPAVQAYDNHIEVGRITGRPVDGSPLVDSFTTVNLIIPHYHVSSGSDPGGKCKAVTWHSGGYMDTDDADLRWMDFKGSGIYLDTDEVDSIEFRPENGGFFNFASGSKFSLYGIGVAA